MAFLPLIHSEEIVLPIAVKRVHSRHRRFIAPGAVWDLMIGVEAIGRDFEFRHDLVHHYRMDYLFGGTSALAGAIAGANAAVTASNAAIAAAQAAAAACCTSSSSTMRTSRTISICSTPPAALRKTCEKTQVKTGGGYRGGSG